MEVFDTS